MDVRYTVRVQRVICSTGEYLLLIERRKASSSRCSELSIPLESLSSGRVDRSVPVSVPSLMRRCVFRWSRLLVSTAKHKRQGHWCGWRLHETRDLWRFQQCWMIWKINDYYSSRVFISKLFSLNMSKSGYNEVPDRWIGQRGLIYWFNTIFYGISQLQNRKKPTGML